MIAKGFATAYNFDMYSKTKFLKFRRVTIRGAQPSEESCLAEGSAGVSDRLHGLSPRALRGLRGVPRGYAGFSEGFRAYACDSRELLEKCPRT